MSLFSCGLQVRVADGPDKGRTFPLDSREMTIGRARNPGDRAPGWVLLSDSQISRIHCDLVWSDDSKAYSLLHRSETNPTLVNGKAVTEIKIAIGDSIKVGNTTLDIQRADFRFGGVAPEHIERIHTARQSGAIRASELAFRDPKREGESQIDTKNPSRKIALSTRSPMHLMILDGAQKGQKIPVTGFKIQVGGHLPEEMPAGPTWWDQDVVIEDSEFPYRCMSWSWRELDKAFEVSLRREVNIPITLERRVDGTDWIAEMPTVHGMHVLIRPFDVMYIGKTTLQLVMVE